MAWNLAEWVCASSILHLFGQCLVKERIFFVMGVWCLMPLHWFLVKRLQTSFTCATRRRPGSPVLGPVKLARKRSLEFSRLGWLVSAGTGRPRFFFLHACSCQLFGCDTEVILKHARQVDVLIPYFISGTSTVRGRNERAMCPHPINHI
jgi:hypothetical protein